MLGQTYLGIAKYRFVSLARTRNDYTKCVTAINDYENTGIVFRRLQKFRINIEDESVFRA